MDVYRIARLIEDSLDGVLDDDDPAPVKTGARVAGGSSTEAMVDVSTYDVETKVERRFVVLVREQEEDEE